MPDQVRVMKRNGTEHVAKLIGLVRVSTGKQEESGLGLQAQRDAIERLRSVNNHDIIRVYEEVESGKHNDIRNRPRLREAVNHARRSGAILAIAKIDRMVRSTQVMTYLKNSGIKFIACDNPYANELTIDILVAVAANEARQISTRTKDALAAYRSHKMVSKRIKLLYPDGVPPEIVEDTAGKLGASLAQCRNLTPEARQKGAKASVSARKVKAVEAYADLAPFMLELRAEGLSLLAIAGRLTDEGHTTRTGKAWNPEQVRRVLKAIG
jgi:DNA invertase Pin-like site-specific DNA recombinase